MTLRLCLLAVLSAVLTAGCLSNQRNDGQVKPQASGRAERTGVQASSLLGVPLYAHPPADSIDRLEADLRAAREALARDPDDADAIIWHGRRLGYLWRMNDAIDVFTDGIRRFPADARFYRHRGHRYISIRRFDLAIADLEMATALIAGKPAQVEPDGQPNARNIPLTTTAFNVWYHLGLARYLQGDFEGALPAWEQARNAGATHDDNIVAVAHWLYMSLRRLGRVQEAALLMRQVSSDMNIIENQAYFRLVMMYKGRYEPDDLLPPPESTTSKASATQPDFTAAAIDDATIGYGVGHWHLYNGRREEAMAVFERVVAGTQWPAFGHIAAEAELARLTSAPVAPSP